MTLDLWYITGLIDAEGSFTVNLSPNKWRKNGYIINVALSLALNYENKSLLERIRNTLSVGNVYYRSRDKTFIWKVSNIKDINNVILPHFYKYPLLTEKRKDFEIFKEIIYKLIGKTHLSKDGIIEIIKLKSHMNLGLSNKLKSDIPELGHCLKKEIVNEKVNINPYWLVGFVDGEGCFFVSIYKSPKSKLGFAVQLSFIITQHIRDISLLFEIKNYLECGRVIKRNNGEYCDLKVNRISDINMKVVKHFSKYYLQGIKQFDFNHFKKVVDIITSQKHLSEDNLNEIREIKSKMYTGRKIM